MLHQLFKGIYLGLATADVTRDAVEQGANKLVSLVIGAEHDGVNGLELIREHLKSAFDETWKQVLQRSNILERKFRDMVRSRITEITEDALSDSTEIDDLRAQLASIRAELSELKLRTNY
jgi:hypothetical protein